MFTLQLHKKSTSEATSTTLTVHKFVSLFFQERMRNLEVSAF